MLRKLIGLVAATTIILAILIAVMGPATKFGLLDYSTSLGYLRMLVLPTMIAVALCGVGLLVSVFKKLGAGSSLFALVAVVMGAASLYAPIKMRSLAQANPFIHDITTDFENPPPIIAAASLSRSNPADYVGDEPAPRLDVSIRQAQADAFPDIVSWAVAGSLEDSVVRARDVLQAMGLVILDETEIENGRLIEAYHRSTWYGFYDDFVVRLSPGEAGIVLDVRSKSRVGLSDLGANAARIRTFRDKFNQVAG